jgi:hypothetical protein
MPSPRTRETPPRSGAGVAAFECSEGGRAGVFLSFWEDLARPGVEALGHPRLRGSRLPAFPGANAGRREIETHAENERAGAIRRQLPFRAQCLPLTAWERCRALAVHQISPYFGYACLVFPSGSVALGRATFGLSVD